MDNNNNNSGNNFLNGFLLGALIGAAVVFLLGTKKGKRLLKTISEEGAENISNILEKAEKSVDLDEFSDDEEDDSVLDKEVPIKERVIATVKPKIKRFFRGVSRKVN